MAVKQLDDHFMICKICGVNKVRRRNGFFKKKVGRTPRWKGDDGRSWNGRTCPECHCKRASVANFHRELLK